MRLGYRGHFGLCTVCGQHLRQLCSFILCDARCVHGGSVRGDARLFYETRGKFRGSAAHLCYLHQLSRCETKVDIGLVDCKIERLLYASGDRLWLAPGKGKSKHAAIAGIRNVDAGLIERHTGVAVWPDAGSRTLSRGQLGNRTALLADLRYAVIGSVVAWNPIDAG